MANLDYEKLIQMFKLLAPDLSALENVVIESWIDLAFPHVSSCRFGSFYNEALVYYAAHLAALNGLISGSGSSGIGVVTGPVVSMKEGDLSVSYGWSGTGDSSASTHTFGKTIYGQQFLDLSKKVGGGTVMTRHTRLCR